MATEIQFLTPTSFSEKAAQRKDYLKELLSRTRERKPIKEKKKRTRWYLLSIQTMITQVVWRQSNTLWKRQIKKIEGVGGNDSEIRHLTTKLWFSLKGNLLAFFFFFFLSLISPSVSLVKANQRAFQYLGFLESYREILTTEPTLHLPVDESISCFHTFGLH